MERLMIIGGHSGDEAVMAGAIAARVVREGGYAVLVALTNGDGGHPTLSRAEYAPQKDREAMAAAAHLGAACELWPVSSRGLEVSDANVRALVTLIRKHKPDTIITHWRDSIHADHVASYHLTVAAIREAAGTAIDDGQERHAVGTLYFGDNWEDAENYAPDIYYSFTEEDEAAWLRACREFEFFRDGFYSFNYTAYYEALHRMRGALALRQGAPTALAVGLMSRKFPKTVLL